jgi:glyceraldehyde 3-phosphate dehydrogenase
MANTRKRARPDDYFKDWKQREALAEGMIPLVGRLCREKNVNCYIYGKPLVNRSVFEIMKDHRYVRQVEGNELSEKETFPVFSRLSQWIWGQRISMWADLRWAIPCRAWPRA